MSEKKGMSWVWPSLADEKSAKEAARQGVIACAWVAVVTAVMAFFKLANIDQSAYIDAVLFAVIGFGIYRNSRTAAVAGLALYVLERAYMWTQVGSKNLILTVLFILMFINAVRGTFAYHKMKKAAVNASVTTA